MGDNFVELFNFLIQKIVWIVNYNSFPSTYMVIQQKWKFEVDSKPFEF